MSKTLSSWIQEADDIIEKRANSKPATEAAVTNDEVTKLAHLLEQQEELSTTPQQSQPQTQIKTTHEKIAYAVAILDTVLNVEELNKLAAFEKKALESGHSNEQIQEYMTKRAGSKTKTLLTALGAGGAAGAAGGAYGHKKGKETGYGQALEDVNKAFRAYSK